MGDHRIEADGGEGGHIEHTPPHGAAAGNHAAAPQGSAIPVDRRDADEGGNLAPIQVAQLREIGDEREGRDIADAGHGLEQVVRRAPQRAGAEGVVQVALQLGQGLGQPAEVGGDAALHPRFACLLVPGGLGAQHLDQLAAAGDEFRQGLRLRGRQRASPRLHRLREPRDVAGVEGIGLGQLARRPREITDLSRVDHGHRQPGAPQRGGDGDLITAGGFQDHQRRGEAAQPRDELAQARVITRDAEALVGRTDVHIDMLLGDIDPHIDPFHDPSL